MTTPSPDAFDYTDDSVIARVAFDIPSQAVNDIGQLTQAMGAMRTQLEAVARAQADWIDYLQQVPVIAERASQSLRDQITQMERIAYIQNEVGGGVGGNVSPTPPMRGGSYSTSAPQGYVNPFQGMASGMGAGPMGGVGMNAGATQAYMQNMAMQDPRMYANMAAARGMAVNPAILGQVGGTVMGNSGMGGVGGTGGGQGWGAPAPGSMSPQATQTARDSASPPNPTESGASTQSEPQHVPSEPTEDAPEWQKTASAMARNVLSEIQVSGRPGGISGAMIRGLGGIAKAASGVGLGATIAGKMGISTGALGGLAKGAGIAGAGALAAWKIGEKIQDAGELATQYSQLGSVQGGGVMEGAGYEAQARIMGLNPFITTDQARQVMQMALREGFRGGAFDTVQGFMVKNFKDMGMSFSEQMDLINASVVKGGDASKSFTENMSDLQDSLDLMKGLSKKGGAALPEREKQFGEVTSALTSMNVDQKAANQAALGFQEMFKDNKVLRDASSGMATDALSNPLFLTQAAQRNGITGLLPEAIPGALADAGVSLDKEWLGMAREIADRAKTMPGGKRNQAAMFHSMLSQYGINIDPNVAAQLYDELTGGRDIEGDMDTQMSAGATGRSVGDRIWSGIKGVTMPIFDVMQGQLPKAKDDLVNNFSRAFGGHVTGEGAQNAVDDYLGHSEYNPEADATNRGGPSFAPAGYSPPALPEGPTDASLVSRVTTEGVVTGNVTITVDQQGRVTAPPTIQLSGQQKAANSGYGSAQLNNAAPGDPMFNHAYDSFPTGGH